jgi:hypothetical protein
VRISKSGFPAPAADGGRTLQEYFKGYGLREAERLLEERDAKPKKR